MGNNETIRIFTLFFKFKSIYTNMNLLDKLKINHRPRSGALDLLKYIGPGLLVTVGFIDPGNWATNLAAGSEFGYALLWVVTFSVS